MSEFIHDDCCERCPNTMECYAKGECLREPPLAEVASSCKCSVIAGNVVPNPECPVHVEVVDVRVAPSRSAAPLDECICEGNWRQIVGETKNVIEEKFHDEHGEEFNFFGIVHGKDDYYYGMSSRNHKTRLLSCVGSIADHGFTLIKHDQVSGEGETIAPVNTTTIDSGGSNTETGRVKLSGVQDHGSNAEIVGGHEASAAPPSEREAALKLEDLSPEQFMRMWWSNHGEEVFEFMRVKLKSAEARAALPQAARHPELRGTWPENCVQRAFVEGAKWWEFRQSGGTMWPSDRDIVEVAAIEKYGHPGAAAVPAPATEWENRYRQLLWESHAGYTHRSYLYGDDGEMQCNHHDCLLDFKRAAIEEIDKHLWEMNLKRAAKQQAVAAVPAPERDERDKLYACYIHDEGELKLVGVALCEVDADGWKGAMEQDASENRIVKETGRIRRGAGATAPPKEGK